LAKFPEPPSAAELAQLGAEPRVLAAGTVLWRLYCRGGDHPTFWNTFRSFGPTRGRFDHHPPPSRLQSRAILYAAGHGPTCLSEVFQDTRIIDREARDPWLVSFELRSDLTLLDLTGTWPTRAGASMAIASGPRPRAQRWSRTIYDAFPGLQGIAYNSSMHANHLAVALYERAIFALPRTPRFHRPLTDPALLPVLVHVARELGYGLV
jgi:hypothetical protein